MIQHLDRNRVAIIGLVTRFLPPTNASPRTRTQPPAGYGVREQCLPFTAATGLGLTIPSPFRWGFCTPAEVPPGARSFRSPIEGGCTERVCYVIDDPALCFDRNQFVVPLEIQRQIGPAPIPGLSFFDRTDQQDHLKLHLPYVLRTVEDVSLLFMAPLNRMRHDGLTVISGLVECDWYSSPVNLVLQLPPAPEPVHVGAGQIIAQAIPVSSALRQPRVEVVEKHHPEACDVYENLMTWRELKDRDRSAYKRLVKSRHGPMA